MPRPTRRLELVLVFAVVALIAGLARDVEGVKMRYAPPSSGDERWFSRDIDGLYHARRVARAIDEGLPAAGRDAYMNFPDGAAIPWPPYYDSLLAIAFGPFAPSDRDARREFLENAVSSAPFAFGVATALAVAWIAWSLGGVGAALVAGGCFALSRGAINYEVLGNGNHRAFVALLTALLFAVVTRATNAESLAHRNRSARLGVVAGLLAGLLLGSWVASLIAVLLVQLALGWLVVRRSREELPGVASFGLAFHLSAALAILPAVLWSPWRETFPWMVINLSWFHPVELAIGALVFAPLALAGDDALKSGTRAARFYPLGVALVLAAIGALCWLANLGPAAGIREGFDWVTRANSFMDVVQESEPLYGDRAQSGIFFATLGLLAPFALLAWIPMARRAFARGERELAIWAIALPPMFVQALQQRRFAEVLAVPLSIAIGLGMLWSFEFLRAKSPALARVPRLAIGAAALALVLLAQDSTIGFVLEARRRAQEWSSETMVPFLAERELCRWLDRNTPTSGDFSVLAHWDKGHAIEWVADRPSVATNFGSYVGEDSYRDPPRFFMSEDPDAAEAILTRRKSRYVLVTANLPFNLTTLVRASDPTKRELYLAKMPNGTEGPTPRWHATIGAMLFADGAPCDANWKPNGSSLGFLRLVHLSPFDDGRLVDPLTRKPAKAGAIWERVAGARIEATGAPGEAFSIELDLAHAERANPLHFAASGTCDSSGRASLRIPYSTDPTPAPNREFRAKSRMRWRLGARSGELDVSERAVEAGESLRVP